MTTILVPYHQDELLTPADIPVTAPVTVHPAFPDGDRWDRLAALYEATAAAVAAAGPVPVVHSGDCLIAGAVVAGVQRAGADPAVVWFDAHADLHTLSTSTSGYLGGLSLRLLTGAHPELYAGRFGLRPVAPGRAVLAGARDIDPAEADHLAGGAIRRLTVDEVSGATVPDGPLVVHVDIDVLDPSEVPGLRFPVGDGPSVTQLRSALDRLVATGRVMALDFAWPWHPAADDEQRTARSQVVAAFSTWPAPPA